MYQIAQKIVYWRTVKLWKPGADGTLQEHAFDVQFKWLDDDAYQQLFADAHEQKLKDAAVVPRFVVGFRGIGTGDGAALPFNDANLQALLADPLVASAVMQEYIRSRDEALEKNFGGPRVAGHVAVPSTTTRH